MSRSRLSGTEQELWSTLWATVEIHRSRIATHSQKMTMGKSTTHRGLSTALLLYFTATSVAATKHSVHIINGQSLIGPVGLPFGFLRGGFFELTVEGFSIVSKAPASSATAAAFDPGFFLQRFENEADFYHHLEELRSDRERCSFEMFRNDIQDDTFNDDDLDFSSNQEGMTAKNGIVLHVSQSSDPSSPPTIRYQFKQGEEGLYFLLFQVCGDKADQYLSSFKADFHYLNYDSLGNPSFLTAGEMRLPLIFFFFSVSYAICAVIWVLNVRDVQAQARRGPIAVFKVHHIMTALVIVKFLATFIESLRYHGIRVNGHAEGWTVLFYVFTMIRGTFLFVVILLLGTGWSIVKPFLNDREKQVVAGVLVLQVLNQVALVTLEHFTIGETPYARWTAVLHLVDIICCCAVLLPIVWQINQLEKTIGEDANGLEEEGMTEEEREMALEEGDKGDILNKLRLFRSFYLLVVAYIYATRILVYLFASMLSYKHLWVKYFVVELVTLTFYVSVGMMFRPMNENPYASVKMEDAEEGGAVEMNSKSKA